MQEKITITGRSDGKGKIRISQTNELSKLASDFPNSQFTISVEVIGKGSESMKGYYFNKIVPDFRDAFIKNGERLTLSETELRMRNLCAAETAIEVPDDESGGFNLVRLRAFNELNKREAWEYIQHLKQIASEEFDFFINDKVLY